MFQLPIGAILPEPDTSGRAPKVSGNSHRAGRMSAAEALAAIEVPDTDPAEIGVRHLSQ